MSARGLHSSVYWLCDDYVLLFVAEARLNSIGYYKHLVHMAKKTLDHYKDQPVTAV
jgi:hypothetical protein